MNPHRINQRIKNYLFPIIAVVLIFLITAICFDFYYDLNDDVAIKDIMSGAYTGFPDGHTNQLLYPLSWFISMVYRFLPNVPVYGLFLLGCYGICFYLIGYRSVQYAHRLRGKLLILLLEVLTFLSLFLWELVYVQYSVVCGLLAATACFWFYTTPYKLKVGEFRRVNLVSLFLLWLAFLLRSEMLLLTTPFIGLIGIFHWTGEVERTLADFKDNSERKFWKQIFAKNNCLKYLVFVAVAFAGCILALLLDYGAFSRSDWRTYREFFDARTTLYDYTWYPSYEENQEFYDKIGVSREQYNLIYSYNFGLDPSIDANTLDKISDFGERARNQGSLPYRVKNSLWEMVSRTVKPIDAPYNYFVLISYGLVAALALIQKNRTYLWKLPLLGLIRTVPWMYLLLAGRAVERIIHPLYVLEFLCLLALLAKELYDRPLGNVERYYRGAAIGIMLSLATVVCLFQFPAVATEQVKREKKNMGIKAFNDYTRGNPGNYYYIDVYSTVSFSEKIFMDSTNTHKNYDILGGWVFHSPLQKQVLEDYAGQSGLSASEALLRDNFFFCIGEGRDVGSLMGHYEAANIHVELELIDTVYGGGDSLVVYKVKGSAKP